MSGNPYSLFGDPAEIAAVSSQLNQIASRLEARSALLQKRVDAMGFEGPKAQRFRSRMDRARSRAIAIAGDLGEIANGFILAANHEAQRIYEWEQAQERLEEGPRP